MDKSFLQRHVQYLLLCEWGALLLWEWGASVRREASRIRDLDLRMGEIIGRTPAHYVTVSEIFMDWDTTSPLVNMGVRKGMSDAE